MRIFTLLFVQLILAAVPLCAQETVSAAGGNAAGSGGSVSFTIGQAVYTAPAAPAGTVSQGVQQAYDVNITLGQNETGVSINCLVYPNPTTDQLQLEITNTCSGSLTYRLCDAKGSIISSNIINGNTTTLSLLHCTPGTYHLYLERDGKTIKSYRIIKR